MASFQQRRRIVMEAPVKMEANALTQETTFTVNVRMDLQDLSVKLVRRGSF